jgi:hypothetical protein
MKNYNNLVRTLDCTKQSTSFVGGSIRNVAYRLVLKNWDFRCVVAIEPLISTESVND